MVAPDGAPSAARVGRMGGVAAALVPLVLLAAILAAAFPDVLFLGRTLSPSAYVPGVLPSGPVGAPAPPLPPPLRDLEGAAWVDEPAPYLIQAALAGGRLPLWNERVGLGAPLAANPNMAAWSPLQLAPNLWPGPLVQDLAWLARVLLLGLSTWVLARALGCGRPAALAAAVALMLSGQTLEWIVHHPLNTDAFVPLALAAAIGVLRRRPGAPVALSLAIAAALLGVKPQSAVTASIFGVLLLAGVVYDERSPRRAGRAPALGMLIGAALLGVALAAIALLPFLESYGHASGLVRAGRSTQSEWTLPLGMLPRLAGGWLGRLSDGAAITEGTNPLDSGPPVAGSAVLVLAAIGAWRARRRALGWVLSATVLVYLTRIFGLLPVPLTGVPVLGSINFVKYCFPLYLALALLAALALEPDVPDGVAPHRRGARRLLPAAAALVLVAEMLWLAPRARPLRVDPYAPAPYVNALRPLVAGSRGRISGPVALAPPLVSGVLGFADLRAIDVLTPRDGYEFVSQLVAPSQGVTWILADPDPLVAATAPGAAVADLRWILSRDPLIPGGLESVARSQASGRRLLRLFSALDLYRVETSSLGGGIRELGGDRRFHWSCVTPCRFGFDLVQRPAAFVAGLAAAEDAEVEVRLREHGVPGARQATARLRLGPGAEAWRDLWLDASGGAPAAGAGPVRVTLEVDSREPRTIFVGGLGPSPGRAREEAEVPLEVAYRKAALARLRLRYADRIAHVYENPAALGDAYLADAVVAAPDLEAVRSCLLAHPGRAVACVADPSLAQRLAPPGEPGAVRVLERRAELVRVESSSKGESLLVVPRLFFPGWHARIDDAAAPIERANAAMMAVVVPPGTHRVELRYAPDSLWTGGAISLVAALMLAVLVVRSVGVRKGRARWPSWFEAPSGRG